MGLNQGVYVLSGKIAWNDLFWHKEQMGAAAAEKGPTRFNRDCGTGRANIILATGASQFEMLRHLVAAGDRLGRW